jgi:MFS family permease
VTPKRAASAVMVGGSAAFLICVMAMTQMPNYWLACGVLVLGGVGAALFGNMQTTLVLTRVPPAVRSRQMGLITVCIGFGPVGQLMIGAVAERLGPQMAVLCSAVVGMGLLLVVGAWWQRAEQLSGSAAGVSREPPGPGSG